MMQYFAEHGFDFTAEDITKAVVESDDFQKNRIDTLEAIKQGAADAVNNNVVSIDRK